MKEDITQHSLFYKLVSTSCGLVMKEDITQQVWLSCAWSRCCGLVMKEDITQQLIVINNASDVVVW